MSITTKHLTPNDTEYPPAVKWWKHLNQSNKMKTPMQEMIEYFEIFQGADKSNQSMPLGIAISIAKSLLEKEKDAMCQFAFDYNDEYVNNGVVAPIQEYYEEYHNITLEQVLQSFNTNQENLQDSTNGYTYYPQENKTVFNTK